MNLAFLGTGAYGVSALESLAGGRHKVLSVVTSPDRPRGRFLKTEPSPIKETADRLGLPVFFFEKALTEAVFAHLRGLAPDFLVVVSFGHLLGREFLSVPKIAPLNIHPSLLPRHRGASPMPWTLLEGDAETGVTVIRMNERMDAGDIASQVRTPVEPGEDLLSLEKRLSLLGARLITETLDVWEAGRVHTTPQNEWLATYTRKFTKDDALLDFFEPAEKLERRVRALRGWPGTFGVLRGKRLLVHRAEVTAATFPAPTADQRVPGEVLSVGPAGIEVGTGKGVIRLLWVQLEGRKQMQPADFLRGFPVRPGERFESSSAGC